MNDTSHPHQYPPTAPSDTLGWECHSCGHWINELQLADPADDCPNDWRGVEAKQRADDEALIDAAFDHFGWPADTGRIMAVDYDRIIKRARKTS